MNTAKQVDEMIVNLKDQVAAEVIPLSDAMWQTAMACVGWPYVYSAWGALCTPSERRKRYGMRPDHETIKTKCKAFDNGVCTGCQWYPGNERTRCADCRGFKDWIYKQFGFDMYGDTVSAQWNHKDNWCVKGQFGVDPIPQNVLVDIFIKKDGKWTHTGFYYNGSTCECSSGVQYFAKMKANRWTHWAVAACFKSGWTMPAKEPEKEPVKEEPMATVKTLRKGSKGEDVKKLQQRLLDLGYKLPRYGADGDYGNETVAAVKAFQKDWGLKQDGIAGPETQKMLNSVPGQKKEKTYTVIVKGLTDSQAKELNGKYPGSEIKEEK